MPTHRLAACAAGALLLFGSLCAHAQSPTTEQRVQALLAQMTLEEKVGQLVQFSGSELTGPASTRQTNLLNSVRQGQVGSVLNVKGVRDTRAIQAEALKSRLHIPLLFALDVIHGYQTVFPVPLGEAASWDMAAIRQSAHLAAREAAASGIHWTFAPMVDVGRDPRWGRVMEGAGEDTYLGSQVARARVLGFQGEKLGGTDAVMACAKHFAAYGAAIAGRDYNAVDMSLQQLWEVYLPPFKAAADAGAATFMNSFNTLNGTPATASSYLQRDILKGQWHYPGFVVSDWGSIREMVSWGYAATVADAARTALLAGNDMDMENDAYGPNLAKLVRAGQVPASQVDEAVRRILRKKFELGLFDDPYRFSDFKREQQVLADPAHRIAAREMARKSMVLLKNERNTLPLGPQQRTIALIGPLGRAKRDLAGSWTVIVDTARIVSPYEGLTERAGRQARVHYVPGCESVMSTSRAGFAAAVAAAQTADVVVLCVGETGDMTGEAKSRTDLRLPGGQEELFAALKATGKPVVVVVFGGRPLIFNTIAEQADAILYAWWPGSEGGHALADVLYGDYNPAGKLPSSFPRSVGQLPLSYQQYNTGRPVTRPDDIRYKSAYMDEVNTPRYAFGHGLSYTTFAYQNLRLSQPSLQAGERVQVQLDLTNTGPVAGEEVVQLYLHDLVASVVRPLKELKDFQKVRLQPGETRTLTFTIDQDKLAFYNQQLQRVAEPGEFRLLLGSASDDIRLEGSLTLQP